MASAEQLLAAGAESVKLEGPKSEAIAALVERGFAVIGHSGLTPQTAADFKQVGRHADEADRVVREAGEIAAAGAFMLVLEHVPDALARRITASLAIPTIGPACDGQVLVINDVLGLGERWPPFSRQYAYLDKAVTEAAQAFVRQVTERSF